jgi:hypothetical protein
MFEIEFTFTLVPNIVLAATTRHFEYAWLAMVSHPPDPCVPLNGLGTVCGIDDAMRHKVGVRCPH